VVSLLKTASEACFVADLFLATGGRTAWSATVTIQGTNVAARYWYDGQFINNAKVSSFLLYSGEAHLTNFLQEDAAEVAMMRLNHPRTATTTAQNFQGGSSNGRWGAR
jgi:hypothetical protein